MNSSFNVNKFILLHIFCVAVLFLFSPVIQAKDKKITVVIDAGHGGKDSGAKGATVDEKVINLAVALKLGNLIADKHDDVKVIYTRKTDKFIELDERANIANRNKADLFISIHANAVEKGKHAMGTETFTLGLARTEENLDVAKRENSVITKEDNYLERYENFDPNSTESYIIFEFMQNKHMEQSVGFASEIQKAFASAKRIDRGVKQAGLLVLRRTSMPSVLVELGFITSREEEKYMKSAAGQNALATALYNAFAKYKKEYDKRTAIQSKTVAPAISPKQEASEETGKKETKSTDTKKDPVVYKIQILISSKKLPATDKRFKGYKNVSYYLDGKMYKYTYFESTDKAAADKKLTQVKKDFNGAFVVAFKNGKRYL
jgi:N-acetylmuramoyl-L-alanine amidase